MGKAQVWQGCSQYVGTELEVFLLNILYDRLSTHWTHQQSKSGLRH